MRRLRTALLAGLAVLVLAAPALAGVPRVQGLAPVPQNIDNATHFDGNNLDMVVTNHGSFAFELESGNSGLYFPRGTTKTVVFASGLWVGAKVNGQVRVTVGEYSQEYAAGVMLPDHTFASEADPCFVVYKMAGENFGAVNYAACKYPYGPPVNTGAPGYDPLNPATWVPQLIGDQTLWSVYNDADPSKHTNRAGNSAPLGIQVEQTTFGFDRQPPLGNVVFLKFIIRNLGGNTLDSAYVSLWSDPDLGGATDDLVGCDTNRSLGFCYNDTNADEMYGSSPPAVGYDFFQGPIVPGASTDSALVGGRWIHGYRNLPMTSFNKYINGTDPKTSGETYNFMKGLNANGTPLIDPVTGQVTTYAVPGDPQASTDPGWLDTNANDRRMMLSAGPFTMAPGDSQEVVAAIIVAQAGDRLASVGLLKQYDDAAQKVFDLNFKIPPPPPAPTVYARAYDGAVDLTWGTEADGDVQISPELNEEYRFEGYNVWQAPASTGPWTRIATYDIDQSSPEAPDSVKSIYGDVFDVTAGGNQRVILQSGTNSGVVHSLHLTEDQITGSPLANYMDYYYAVTAYSYEVRHCRPYYERDSADPLGRGNLLGYITGALERSKRGVTVRPMGSAAVQDAEVQHTQGVSDGQVDVRYVNQSAIINHGFKVGFRVNPDTESDLPYVWDLLDTTTGDTLLKAQTDQGSDPSKPIIHGFIPNVIGPPLGIRSQTWEGPDSLRWLSGVNWDMSAFGGGVGVGAEFQGSTLAPADYAKIVEIRFSASHTDSTLCRVQRRDLGYAAQTSPSIFPGSAWDVTDPAHPRRLNICLVEDNGAQPADQRWDPDGSDLGAREYLFIMNSSYFDGSGNPTWQQYGDGEGGTIPGPQGRRADVLLAIGAKVRSEHRFLQNDATWVIRPNWVNTEQDVFVFHTFAPGTHAGSVVGNTLANIRAVPNPYYDYSAYELNQFDRELRITNLPTVDCTVRFFSLQGVLIRTVEKLDPTRSWVRWDLKNESGIPVGSGIYVYHVEAKGIGSKIGKVAVLTEKERLNRF
jgi:hypothetical protein